jgi:hypothetical protein
MDRFDGSWVKATCCKRIEGSCSITTVTTGVKLSVRLVILIPGRLVGPRYSCALHIPTFDFGLVVGVASLVLDLVKFTMITSL